MVKVLPVLFICQHYDRSSHKIGLRQVATRFDQIIGLIKGILVSPGDLNYGLGGALQERPLNPLPTPR